MGERNGGASDYRRSAVFAPSQEGERALHGVAAVELAGGGQSSRRRVLKWVIRAGYLAFAVAFVVPATALKSLSRPGNAIAAGDSLVYAPTTSGAAVGEPLRADELDVGTGVQVFPQGKEDDQNNIVEVVRIAEGNDGLVAYSAICTHLGCAVYAGLSDEGLIACPCHGSQFDPANGAAVVGGPAPRPLPSLPITVNADGAIVVAGEFSGPVGIAE